ncbi:phospho-N-acetylmuramoyl-pentapeptide-transferase [Candidatus Babeliales bacterium]|nr:phospho-N-acetylmuramoyl-pentapeptide-transferase [Candidatus Babeliales bacterium]
MLFHVAGYLKHNIASLNVVHYVSFRAMAALLSSLGLSFICGSWFIKKSQQFFKSKARPYTPHTHQLKNDMPTMGGIFIVFVVIMSTLLWCDLSQVIIWIALGCLVGFSLIGALDDWKKIHKKGGISARLKMGLQLSVALLVALSWIYFVQPSDQLCIPFFKNFNPSLGFLFVPWIVFVLVGTSNAVNLTDGLDGLAIGALLSNFGTFSLICYIAGHTALAGYLMIPFTGTSELAVFGASLCGASLGFLWYNTYPAQIIMGDVGSLGLGGVLAFMALACKQEVLLAIAGGLFVIETVSVMIQVFSLKYFGKRMFRMAPLHHHFELKGWPESKITVRFCIIAFILSLLALMTLKIR